MAPCSSTTESIIDNISATMSAPASATAEQQEQPNNNLYVEKLLGALKQLEEITGLQVGGLVEQAIAATKKLQEGLLENAETIKKVTPKCYDDVVEIIIKLRASLETLPAETRVKALQIYSSAQEYCINISRGISDTASVKYEKIKTSATDMAAVVDVSVVIASLKSLQDEIMRIKSDKQESLEKLVKVALDHAVTLQLNVKENCHTYLEKTSESVSSIRQAILETSMEKKELLLDTVATCQEGLLGFSTRIRFQEQLMNFKEFVGLPDVNTAIASLKSLGEEVKTLDKEKLEQHVKLAYEKAVELRAHLHEGVSDLATKRYEETLEAMTTIREQLSSIVTDQKANALVMFNNAQMALSSLAQKVRLLNRSEMFCLIKDRAFETAVFLDNRFSLFEAAQAYGKVALDKASEVMENNKVSGAIGIAKTIGDKIYDVDAVMEKGYGLVESTKGYVKDELDAARTRNAPAPSASVEEVPAPTPVVEVPAHTPVVEVPTPAPAPVVEEAKAPVTEDIPSTTEETDRGARNRNNNYKKKNHNNNQYRY